MGKMKLAVANFWYSDWQRQLGSWWQRGCSQSCFGTGEDSTV